MLPLLQNETTRRKVTPVVAVERAVLEEEGHGDVPVDLVGE